MSSQGPFLNRISNNHSIPDRGSKTLPGQPKLKKLTKNSLAAINQASLPPEQSKLFEPIIVKNPYKQDSNIIIPPLAALHRELARMSFKEFVRQALAIIEPGTTFYLNWMTDAICNHLQATAEGLARGENWPAADPHFLDKSESLIRDLIINVPPRSLKSTITSVLFPAWCWVNWPNIKFMFVSFSHNLSKRDSRNTRRLIESEWYQRNWGNRFTLSADSNTLLRFDNNVGGFRYAVSVGGQILGEGYQILVCLKGDTLITTDHGPVSIQEIVEKRLNVKVLGPSGRFLKINDYKKNPSLGRKIYEIKTSDNKTITATEEHPFYCEKINQPIGYIPVKDMVSLLDDQRELFLLRLRERENQTPISSPLRTTSPCEKLILQPCLSRSMAKGTQQPVLQRRPSRHDLLGMWSSILAGENSIQYRSYENELVLWSNLSKEISDQAAGHLELSELLTGFRKEEKTLYPEILHSTMRGPIPPNTNPRQWEWALRSWRTGYSIHSWVHQDAQATNQTERWASLRHLQDWIRSDQKYGCSPYRREQGSPLSTKLSNIMWKVSQKDAQGEIARPERDLDERVRITSITCVGEAPEFTYNLDVEDDHAYYANGILTHNCDDMNNTKDIHSKVKRDQVKNIWDDVFPTRSNNKKTAVRIIICQRSHDDDLTGHVLRKNKLKRWVLLRIPCEFEKDFKCTTPLPWEDPRKNDGDLICPERDGPAEIAALKEDLSNSGGSFNIAAQLQQRPVPVEGGVFEHDWWQLYRWADLPTKNQWEDSCISVDMSFGSIKDTASFTVMQAWCKVGNRFYLLGQKRGRWKYTKAKRELVRFIQRYHYIYAIYVENKANGPAVMDDLGETEGISGLIPVEPDGDKVARAYAVSPLVMAKNVFIPDPEQVDCEWVREKFFPEVDLFPMAANDDITDTLTQALRKLRGSAAFGMSHDDLDQTASMLNDYDSSLTSSYYDDSSYSGDPGFGAGFLNASSTSNAFGSSTMQTQTANIPKRKDPVEVFNSIGSVSSGGGGGVDDFWGF